MRYIPNSSFEREQMLQQMGLQSVGELFRGIPEHLQLKRPLHLPQAMSESEALTYFRGLAEQNETRGTGQKMISFLGGGAYDHFIPTVVDTLISRSEFYTSYTPYQPEISQGTLQAIFEFQTMICELTGMDVSNASLYDGSTATAEAASWRSESRGVPRSRSPATFIRSTSRSSTPTSATRASAE